MNKTIEITLMNLGMLLVSTLFPTQSFGQKWHLNKVDNSKTYAYEYWFHFENLNDTNSYQLIKTSNRQSSTFELYDNLGDTLVFANIRLENIETDSVINLISDLNGKASFPLEKGKYQIGVSAINYDYFNIEFEIEQSIDLKFFLGRAPDLDVFQINSVMKLDESKILEIIDCVKQNRTDFYDACSEDEVYMILMHL